MPCTVLVVGVPSPSTANTSSEQSLVFEGGSAAYEATINSMRSLLSEREHQLSRLEADLAIARAYSGSGQLEGESAQAESALKIELDVLRRRLSEKEAQILSGEERLSCLEAVHRVAQVCMPVMNYPQSSARQSSEFVGCIF